VMGHERARRGAARHRMHHGRFHLDEFVGFELFAYLRDDLLTDLEPGDRRLVGEQVHLAAAIAFLHVGHPVEFFRRRAERFAEDPPGGHLESHFTRAGFEDVPFQPEDVAEVHQVAELFVDRVADLVFAHIDLEPSRAVLHVGEGGLPHVAPGHQPPRDLHGRVGRMFLVVQPLVFLPENRRLRDPVERPGIGVDVVFPHQPDLVPAKACDVFQ